MVSFLGFEKPVTYDFLVLQSFVGKVCSFGLVDFGSTTLWQEFTNPKEGLEKSWSLPSQTSCTLYLWANISKITIDLLLVWSSHYGNFLLPAKLRTCLEGFSFTFKVKVGHLVMIWFDETKQPTFLLPSQTNHHRSSHKILELFFHSVKRTLQKKWRFPNCWVAGGDPMVAMKMVHTYLT